MNGCVTDYNSSGGCDWLGSGRRHRYLRRRSQRQPGLSRPAIGNQRLVGRLSLSLCASGLEPLVLPEQHLFVHTTDLDPANYPRYNASTNPNSTIYYGEVVYIVTDQWPTERYNDYSTRKLVVGTTLTTPSGTCGPLFTLDFTTGTGNLTIPFKPAITQWKVERPDRDPCHGRRPRRRALLRQAQGYRPRQRHLAV